MTREEILHAVTKLYAGDGVEEEDIALVERMRQELPYAKISDLIFHDFRGLTPEQVVEEAFRRQEEHIARMGKE